MNDTARKELDVLELLMQDHREIESLFRDFEQLLKSGKDTTVVVATACAELKMHDTIETDLFYSALADAAQDPSQTALLEKSEDEHDVILELIEKLERMRGDTKGVNSRFAVLAERMKQHILSEESTVFPLVKTLNLDLQAIAAAMRARRPQLAA
jgi:hemerythrin-like domain-containing protein